MVKWCKNLKIKVERDKPPQVKLFVQRNVINVQRSSIESMKTYMHNVKEVMRKVEKLPKRDIRRYFEERIFLQAVELGCRSLPE